MLILKGEIHVRRQHRRADGLVHRPRRADDGPASFLAHEELRRPGIRHLTGLGILIHKSCLPRCCGPFRRWAASGFHAAGPGTRGDAHRAAGGEAFGAGQAGGQPGARAEQSGIGGSARGREPGDGAARQPANRFKLVNLCLTDEQITEIEALGAGRARAADRSRQRDRMPAILIVREEALRTWLDDAACDDAWEVAAQLAEQGVTVADLDELLTSLGPSGDLRCAAIFRTLSARVALSGDTAQLVGADLRLDQRGEGLLRTWTARRFWKWMCRPGMDATLQMLQSRMTHVTVVREYEPNLPCISAYGGELNQVWTALIENALDALGNQGTLRTRLPARRRDDAGGDLGYRPGDSAGAAGPHLRAVLHDQAAGTGAGTWTGQCDAHRAQAQGHISVRSEPGATCFRVRLPLDQLQAY